MSILGQRQPCPRSVLAVYSILQLTRGEVREYGSKSGGLDMFTDRWSALCSSKGTAQ